MKHEGNRAPTPLSPTSDRLDPAAFRRRVTLELSAVFVLSLYVFFLASQRYFLPTVGILAGLFAIGLAFLLGPYVGFAFYFATTFVQTVTLPNVPLSLNQIAGIMFIVSWMNHFFRGKIKGIRSPLLAPLLIMFLYVCVNTLTGRSLEGGLDYFRFLVIYFFFCIFLATMVKDTRAVKKIFWIIVSLTFCSSLVGVGEIFLQRDIFGTNVGTWTGLFRIDGTAPNAIVFGFTSVFAFPFGYYLFLTNKTRPSGWLALYMSLFIVFISLFTFNRQTLIIIFLMCFLVSRIFKNVYSRTILLVLGIIVVLAVPFFASTLVARLTSLSDLSKDYSVMIRRDTFIISTEMLKKHPVTGVGMGSFPFVWEQYRPKTTKVTQYHHGAKEYIDFGYMQVLTEGGIVGFLLFLIVLYTYLRYLTRARRQALRDGHHNWANLLSTILICFWIFVFLSFTQDTFLYTRTWFLYGMALSIASPKLKESFLSEGKKA